MGNSGKWWKEGHTNGGAGVRALNAQNNCIMNNSVKYGV